MKMLQLELSDADAATLLAVYVNDHLAGATAGVELARRTLRNNRGTEYESFLRELAHEIDEDRATLIRVVGHLGVRPSPVKQAAAFAAERIGRAKLNGQLVGYSPLSRLVELEGLGGGVEMKANLWRSLRAVLPPQALPGDVDLDELVARAERQRERIERHRLAAAVRAFGDV